MVETYNSDPFLKSFYKSHFGDFNSRFTATTAAKYIIARAKAPPAKAYFLTVFYRNEDFIVVIVIEQVEVIVLIV